jgi:uncharacterized membrane protein
MERWNGPFNPNLFDPAYANATKGIALHFIGGGIILVFGSIQLIEAVLNRFLNFHRWLGRLYVLACILTAIGGLIFILLRGTVGGMMMDFGFAAYGKAMLLCSIYTIKNARLKLLRQHRAWAIDFMPWQLALGYIVCIMALCFSLGCCHCSQEIFENRLMYL